MICCHKSKSSNPEIQGALPHEQFPLHDFQRDSDWMTLKRPQRKKIK